MSILNNHQWEIDRQLGLHLNDDWHRFIGSGLSAFFNPDLYFGISDNEANLILRSSALFSIASPPPNCELRLMVIEPGNIPLEKFLNKHGVQFLHYSPLIPAEEFVKKVDEILLWTKTKKHTQRLPVNYAELRVRRLIMSVSVSKKENARYERESGSALTTFLKHGYEYDEAHAHLAKRSYRVLHEVALHRLQPTMQIHHLSEKAKKMLAESSVDLLIHSRDSHNQPLVAVEVDGPHHAEPKQIEKDNAKDEILKKFGIAIFRIKPEDASFWTNSSALTRIQKERIDNYGKLISRVVLSMAVLINVFGKLQNDIDACEAVCVKNEDALSKALFGKDYFDLTKNQKEIIFYQLEHSPSNQKRNESIQHYENELKNALESAINQITWQKDLAQYLSLPKIYGDCKTGLWASTTLTLPGHNSITLQSPSIRGTVEIPDPELVIGTLDKCLICFLAEEARRQIRILTPAKRGQQGN